MTIEQQIQADMKEAMKAKDKVTLSALRAIKSAFMLEKTKEGASDTISDDEALKIIQKQIKQRKDSAEIYKSQNRPDLYEPELAEAAAMEKYLPAQLTEEELTAVLKEIIAETGASSPREMGKVMGIATKKLAGKADGKMIASTVKKLLSE